MGLEEIIYLLVLSFFLIVYLAQKDITRCFLTKILFIIILIYFFLFKIEQEKFCIKLFLKICLFQKYFWNYNT